MNNQVKNVDSQDDVTAARVSLAFFYREDREVREDARRLESSMLALR